MSIRADLVIAMKSKVTERTVLLDQDGFTLIDKSRLSPEHLVDWDDDDTDALYKWLEHRKAWRDGEIDCEHCNGKDAEGNDFECICCTPEVA